MITILPEPLSATSEKHGPVMIIGIANDPNDIRGFVGITVDGDGHLFTEPIESFRADWRFSFRLNEWVDVSPYGELDADEETADDRSEEVQGDVPEPDGTD